mmetsp:Transcript_34349/g.39132  ORF Transcript_34349/g.39132 Transcript_34349/m.39132 type:complete len:253 (-) Transcript_34349:411-1169(-)
MEKYDVGTNIHPNELESDHVEECLEQMEEIENKKEKDEHENSPGGQSGRKEYAVSKRWERQILENDPTKDYHTYFCFCARRLGNMFILLEKSDGRPCIVAGPCWPFCMGVTVPLILGISALVCIFILFNNTVGLPLWVAYIYIVIVGLVILTLFMVSCRDPGLMERVTDPEAGEGGWFWNEQVGSFRPPGALYCRECEVLIEGYDHLCPWTGTGIGHGNMLAFKAFVVGVNLLCYFSIALVCFVLLDGLVSE